MRPRSSLLSEKRRLVLPTITEGAEETVRDLNEANMLRITGHSQSVSSEDYLLSICHLAHPTFPTRDAAPDVIHARQLEAVRQRQPRLSGAASAADAQRGEETRASGQVIVGTCDPLEFIYGPQNNNVSGGARQSFVEGRFARRRGSAWDGQDRSRAHSGPRASSPTLCCRRESGCRECRAGTGTGSGRRGGPADRGAEETRRHELVVKQSFISQWISDCRSAWREARARACVLPAIAEI